MLLTGVVLIMTFFGLDVNEIAVAIQLGSHLKNNQKEEWARSVPNEWELNG